ncbi:hypothetical protein NP493_1587g00011 [Ridgeia piscesae]|uniref:Uncharacterized protein n=1 Tax=Ridgeia piscesae TaxID=27915 RepID=A0AAD9N8V1_RIDPI|nr:hypothetical protein NP493_1587g00011 [Ridgeia piscesae]
MEENKESAPPKGNDKGDKDGEPTHRKKPAKGGGCCNFGTPTSSGTNVSRQSVSRSAYHQNIKSDLRSGLNINLVFTAFIIVFGTSFQFGYNIGVLNQIKYCTGDSHSRKTDSNAL